MPSTYSDLHIAYGVQSQYDKLFTNNTASVRYGTGSPAVTSPNDNTMYILMDTRRIAVAGSYYSIQAYYVQELPIAREIVDDTFIKINGVNTRFELTHQVDLNEPIEVVVDGVTLSGGYSIILGTLFDSLIGTPKSVLKLDVAPTSSLKVKYTSITSGELGDICILNDATHNNTVYISTGTKTSDSWIDLNTVYLENILDLLQTSSDGIDSSSTDEQIPTSKAVYEFVNDKDISIEHLPIDTNIIESVEDLFNGDGTTLVFVLSRRVSGILSVEIDGNPIDSSNYEIHPGLLTDSIQFSTAPSSGTNNISVIYNGSTNEKATTPTAVVDYIRSLFDFDNKGLSTNDFNDYYKTKLDEIVLTGYTQANWLEEDDTKDAYIKNKPKIVSTKTQTASATTGVTCEVILEYAVFDSNSIEVRVGTTPITNFSYDSFGKRVSFISPSTGTCYVSYLADITYNGISTLFDSDEIEKRDTDLQTTLQQEIDTLFNDLDAVEDLVGDNPIEESFTIGLQQVTKSFTFNYTNDTYTTTNVFELTFTPSSISNLRVTVNGNSTTNYTYDSTTNAITINDTLTSGDEIFISDVFNAFELVQTPYDVAAIKVTINDTPTTNFSYDSGTNKVIVNDTLTVNDEVVIEFDTIGKVFLLNSIPDLTEDYSVEVDGIALTPITDYSIVGRVLTITSQVSLNNIVTVSYIENGTILSRLNEVSGRSYDNSEKLEELPLIQNDISTIQTKLDTIETGAEVNVQANWDAGFDTFTYTNNRVDNFEYEGVSTFELTQVPSDSNTISVTVNGTSTTNFGYNPDTNEVTINDSLSDGDEIVISYSIDDRSFALSNTVEDIDSIIVTINGNILDDSNYTYNSESNTLTIASSVEILNNATIEITYSTDSAILNRPKVLNSITTADGLVTSAAVYNELYSITPLGTALTDVSLDNSGNGYSKVIDLSFQTNPVLYNKYYAQITGTMSTNTSDPNYRPGGATVEFNGSINSYYRSVTLGTVTFDSTVLSNNNTITVFDQNIPNASPGNITIRVSNSFTYEEGMSNTFKLTNIPDNTPNFEVMVNGTPTTNYTHTSGTDEITINETLSVGNEIVVVYDVTYSITNYTLFADSIILGFEVTNIFGGSYTGAIPVINYNTVTPTTQSVYNAQVIFSPNSNAVFLCNKLVSNASTDFESITISLYGMGDAIS